MPGPVIPLTGNATPELHLLAQLTIERILYKGGTVLEFGSGHSTIWFADLGCNIVSVEPDNDWYDAVQGWLTKRNYKVDLHLKPPKLMASVACTFPDKYFDLVLVDGYDIYRKDCIQESKNKVKPLGWLIVDDIQVGKLNTQASNILTGWHRTDMRALYTRKTGQVRTHQTCFFRRPECS